MCVRSKSFEPIGLTSTQIVPQNRSLPHDLRSLLAPGAGRQSKNDFFWHLGQTMSQILFQNPFPEKNLKYFCQTGWCGDENTMVKISQKIVPHIWLEKDAEKAAEFYVSVFKNSMILKTSYYPKAAEEVSGQKEGSVMTVRFKLEGQEFIALNGGPVFKLNEAVSFMVFCDTQEEIDYFWNKLSFVKEALSSVVG